jgi:nitroreductase
MAIMSDNRLLTDDALLAGLRWRYATKKFDPARKIPTPTWATLEEALRLTPSSFGLQPWKLVIVQDPATRAKLTPAAWGQPQVADCSHLVVFAIKKNLGEKEIDAYVRLLADARGVSVESLASYRQMMMDSLVTGPRSRRVDDWAARQAYIALGNFMTCAAMLGVDACPMEGFDPAQYDQILGLGARGLASVVTCAAGYRAADDKYALAAKARFGAKDVFERA